VVVLNASKAGVSNSNWLRGRIGIIQGFAGSMKIFLGLLGPHQTSRSVKLITIVNHKGYHYYNL
jgi:hypothetical protein